LLGRLFHFRARNLAGFNSVAGIKNGHLIQQSLG
jgi:hypothetical protein